MLFISIYVCQFPGSLLCFTELCLCFYISVMHLYQYLIFLSNILENKVSSVLPYGSYFLILILMTLIITFSSSISNPVGTLIEIVSFL